MCTLLLEHPSVSFASQAVHPTEMSGEDACVQRVRRMVG